MGASIVSGRDASPVFQPSEHTLDEVALLVAVGIVGNRQLSVLASWDARLDATVAECFPEPVAVIASVGDQDVGVGQGGQHGRGSAVVADLAFGEQQDQGPALAVADGVQLGVQAALGASDAAGNSPFLSRLEAVRCAFRWVASIITVSVASASAARLVKMRSNTPIRLQRMKRL